ncbi:MAG TPA: response regulator transcription factor [Chroococcales cyanobacterium]
MAKLLIVEDDPSTRKAICQWLTSDRYVVESTADGAEALDLLKFCQYDLVVLDLMLPGLSGLDVLTQYRHGGGSIPVLLLTGKDKLEEKERGLDLGADDYLTKPFHMRELSARIRALLRRPASHMASTVICNDLVVDLSARTVKKAERPVHLFRREFALLEFFLKHQNQVFSAENLLDRVWASDSEVSAESVRTYIRRLRSKIDSEGEPSYVETVHGFGYKFRNPDK